MCYAPFHPCLFPVPVELLDAGLEPKVEAIIFVVLDEQVCRVVADTKRHYYNQGSHLCAPHEFLRVSCRWSSLDPHRAIGDPEGLHQVGRT